MHISGLRICVTSSCASKVQIDQSLIWAAWWPFKSSSVNWIAFLLNVAPRGCVNAFRLHGSIRARLREGSLPVAIPRLLPPRSHSLVLASWAVVATPQSHAGCMATQVLNAQQRLCRYNPIYKVYYSIVLRFVLPSSLSHHSHEIFSPFALLMAVTVLGGYIALSIEGTCATHRIAIYICSILLPSA